MDSPGVVLYSEELLELTRMWDMELNLLMVDLTMRRASMVEEKGSPSASSAILVIWLSMVVSGSILFTSDCKRGGGEGGEEEREGEREGRRRGRGGEEERERRRGRGGGRGGERGGRGGGREDEKKGEGGEKGGGEER